MQAMQGLCGKQQGPMQRTKLLHLPLVQRYLRFLASQAQKPFLSSPPRLYAGYWPATKCPLPPPALCGAASACGTGPRLGRGQMAAASQRRSHRTPMPGCALGMGRYGVRSGISWQWCRVRGTPCGHIVCETGIDQRLRSL